MNSDHPATEPVSGRMEGPTISPAKGLIPALDPSGEQVVAISPSLDAPAKRLVSLVSRFRHQLTNLTAFTFLQAASYLIPVVTIPYFARALGIAAMGQLAVAGAVALAAGVVMDYAIQLSGTRFAAEHADDPGAINAYLDTTNAVKAVLLCPILLGLVTASTVLAQVTAHFWVFFWSLASAAMICLFPQWLFQGLLAMPAAARILVACRVAAAAAAMLLVRSSADAFVVPMTQALAGAVALLAAAITLKRRYGIMPRLPARGTMLLLLRENWTLFSATAWGAAYAHGAIIVMSTMLSTTSIGFYSIAQKISQAFVSMFNVAAQTGFPSFVRSHGRNVDAFVRQVRLYMGAVMVSSALVLFAMFVVRRPLYMFFAGQYDATGITVFSLWLAASLFTIASVSLNPVMVVLRLDGAMARFYQLTGLAFLIGAPVACAWYGVVGMASAMLTTEAMMALFFASSVIGGLRRAATNGAGGR